MIYSGVRKKWIFLARACIEGKGKKEGIQVSLCSVGLVAGRFSFLVSRFLFLVSRFFSLPRPFFLFGCFVTLV